MLKLTKRVIAPLAAVIGLTGVAFEAQATSAFARQMEMNCMGCHNQQIPMLNSFGRAFKLSSYTMTSGNKSMITGGDLGMSMPLNINAGAGLKSVYNKSSATNAAGDVRSSFGIPSGAAIFVSGKVAEGVGVNTLWNGDGVVHAQASFSRPVGSARVGAAMYGAMGHGAFIATEAYNTGLHKELQMFDNATRANAIQAMSIGLGSGPSSGLVAFYGRGGLTLSGGLRALGFNSTFTNGSLDNHGSNGTQYRLSYDLPAMAGWNMMVGAFGVGGTTTGTTSALFENTPLASKPFAGNINDHEVNGSGLDMQAQGAIGGMDTMVILAHVADHEVTISNRTTGAVAMKTDSSATSLAAQIMPSSTWGLRLGYMTFSDNNNSTKDYTTMSIGANYNYADNVRFSLENTNIDNDTGEDFSEIQLTSIIVF